MSFTEYATLPAFTQASGADADDEGGAKWSGDCPPPSVGDVINMRINGFGPMYVTGYFTQDGWLGVFAVPLCPPDWWLKQRAGEDAKCGVFGAELGAEAANVWSALGCTAEQLAALQAYRLKYSAKGERLPWKERLLGDWMKAKVWDDCPVGGHVLHRIRNVLGPTWLDALELPTRDTNR